MDETEETPVDRRERVGRWNRWAAGAAAAVGVGVAIGVFVLQSKSRGAASVDPGRGGAGVADLIKVQAHLRNQALGPGYSLHRPILIDSYARRRAV
jgi:hypothetical protein